MALTVRLNYFDTSISKISKDIVQEGAGSPLTAKGQLYAFDGSNNVALISPPNGRVPISNSLATVGFEWGLLDASFGNQERLGVTSNVNLLVTDSPFQYIQANNALDVLLPTSSPKDTFFWIRSLNGSNVITLKDEDDPVTPIVLLGDNVNNGSGIETRLLVVAHRTNTQWVINLL